MTLPVEAVVGASIVLEASRVALNAVLLAVIAEKAALGEGEIKRYKSGKKGGVVFIFCLSFLVSFLRLLLRISFVL